MIYAAAVTKPGILRQRPETGTEASVRLRRRQLHGDGGNSRPRAIRSEHPIKIECPAARMFRVDGTHGSAVKIRQVSVTASYTCRRADALVVYDF